MNNKYFFLILLMFVSLSANSQTAQLNVINIDELREQMKYLSSDEMQGRRTGSEGNLKASEYIAAQAVKAGLRPLPGRTDMFQTLSFIRSAICPDSTMIVLKDTTGTILGTLPLEPVMIPRSGIDLTGEIVFAGYGYMNSRTKYSDFQGMSFKNRIVIVMTRKPDLTGNGMPGKDEKIDENLEMRKLTPLLMQGPKAILFVADPAYGNEPISGVFSFGETYKLTPLFKIASMDFSMNLGLISADAVNRILEQSGTTLTALQQKIAETKKPVSFVIPGVEADMKIGVRQDTVFSSNVAGYIEGSDPVLKSECVIYTAHYDHAGVEADGTVNNGANDNASGTIGLLGIAKAFSALDKKPARSIVFLWTTGEEEGLYGSGYYVSNPLFPLDKTVADLNFDMIGRSKMPADTGKVMGERLDINGRDTIKLISARDCRGIIDCATASGREAGITVIDQGKGTHFSGSDHYNFVLKGVPAVFFFTGLHRDYHRSTDDYEFVDFEKLLKTARTGFLTGLKIANDPARPVVSQPGVK